MHLQVTGKLGGALKCFNEWREASIETDGADKCDERIVSSDLNTLKSLDKNSLCFAFI